MTTAVGNGAFLLQIVKRYISSYQNLHGSLSGIEKDLEKYIHGIDIDSNVVKDCIESLNKLIYKQNIAPVKWDIYVSNTLSNNSYNNKMDYVVANPPYVRVHNLENTYSSVKNFSFAKTGMTDLFIVFFEIGFNMLNKTGKMAYISPNSFYSSLARKST